VLHELNRFCLIRFTRLPLQRVSPTYGNRWY